MGFVPTLCPLVPSPWAQGKAGHHWERGACTRCNHFLSYKTFISFKGEPLKARECLEQQLSVMKWIQRVQTTLERQPCVFACAHPSGHKRAQSGYKAVTDWLRPGQEGTKREGPGQAGRFNMRGVEASLPPPSVDFLGPSQPKDPRGSDGPIPLHLEAKNRES